MRAITSPGLSFSMRSDNLVASSILPVLRSVSSKRSCNSSFLGSKFRPRWYSLMAASVIS